MKILILTGSYAPEIGGIAELVRGLAGGLLENGIRVHILAATPGASSFSSQALPVTEFDLPRRGYLSRVSACRNAILRLAKQIEFGRVITSSWSPFAVELPRTVNKRNLSVDILCHGMDLLEPSKSIRYRYLMRRTLRRAATVISNSRYTAGVARVMGAPEGKIVVIPPGVDPERFVPGQRDKALLSRYHMVPDAPILLSVGRLVERKGFDLIIRALPQVLKEHASTTYLVVGDGPDRARLQALASTLEVAASVRFAGLIPDNELLVFYQSADVFVMPSRQIDGKGQVEGFGIVFLEAACCELPVVGGKSGGMADAVVEGTTGYLVDPEDPKECGAKLVALLSNPELRRHMGVSARQRALAEFRWPQIAARYLATMQ